MTTNMQKAKINEECEQRYVGRFCFDKEERFGYILTENGEKIPTSPLHSYFGSLLDFEETHYQMMDFYSFDDCIWFLDITIEFANGNINCSEYYYFCEQYFEL